MATDGSDDACVSPSTTDGTLSPASEPTTCEAADGDAAPISSVPPSDKPVLGPVDKPLLGPVDKPVLGPMPAPEQKVFGTLPSSDKFASSDTEAGGSCKEVPVAESVSSCPMMKSTLVVRVTDFRGQPVKFADVTVSGLGTLTTRKDGLANFEEVEAGSYNVSATKEGYRPGPEQAVGPAKASQTISAGASVVVTLLLDVFRENLVFVGSEMDYKIFWTKMMFVAAAWFECSKGGELRFADRTTVAYVDNGYTSSQN
jgi:hypothetical protein